MTEKPEFDLRMASVSTKSSDSPIVNDPNFPTETNPKEKQSIRIHIFYSNVNEKNKKDLAICELFNASFKNS